MALVAELLIVLVSVAPAVRARTDPVRRRWRRPTTPRSTARAVSRQAPPRNRPPETAVPRARLVPASLRAISGRP